MVEIVRGLNEGQQIVVEGVQRVRPGQPVHLIVQARAGAPAAAAARRS